MNNTLRSYLFKKRWIDLPLILAPIILLFHVLIPGKTLYWGIMSLQFIPWHWEALRILQAGGLPLWNQWNGMGAPLLANYQSALVYPPTWLVLFAGWVGGIQWMAWSHGLLVVLHLVWAGLGMRRLTDFLGFRPFSQVVCGLGYGLSGYLVARGSFLTMIQAASWIPWILLAASQFAMPIKKRESGNLTFSPKAIVFLSLAFTGQWLSGHAQLAWYTLLFCMAWMAAGALINGGGQKLRKIILPVGISGLLGFLLSSIQLIPTAEYFFQSQRAGAIDYATALSYSLWPWRFITFLLPDFFGNPGNGDYWGYGSYWEDAIYIGLLPIVFVIFIVIRSLSSWDKARKQPYSPFLWFSILSILIITTLALGWNTPIFPWLFQFVPTFGSFNGPTRWMIFVDICLLLLAGLGASEWSQHRVLSRKWVNLGIAGMSGLFVCIGFAWFTHPDITKSLMYSMLLSGFLSLGYFTLARFKPATSVRTTWLSLIVFWFCLDLLLAGFRLNPAVNVKEIFPDVENGNISAEDSGRVFIATEDERALRFNRFFLFEDIQPTPDLQNISSILLPNINILYSTGFLNNFDPMIPGRFHEFIEEVDLAAPAIRDRYLALAGVKTQANVNPFDARVVTWEQVDAFPQSRMLYCPQYNIDGDQVLKGLRKAAAEDKLDTFLMVEGAIPALETCVISEDTGSQVLETKIYSARKNFEVIDNPEPGWLVISDTWYPGWKAEIDGKPTEVLRSNYVFQSVEVPAGNHRIELVYDPTSLKVGVCFAIVGILFVLGMLKYYWKFSGGNIERKR
ncbi:MAG: YfhO family protein [Leptolinea sp.]|nr:YfhO family protein [Leptolinea sp.]